MYRALLVCNSTFPNDPAELPELYGPSRDGLLLWNALVDPVYGRFDSEAVLVLFEKSASEILEYAGAFFGQADVNDTVLFYYSGHGQRYSSQLVLCGRDTSANNLLGTGVSAAVLKDMMSTSRAKATVVILDCCHAGAFKGGASFDNLAGIGRYVIAASGAQKEAGDAQQFGLPSPFTASLIDALKSAKGSGSGEIDLEELYSFILTNLPEKYPRPYKNFYGSGVVKISGRPDYSKREKDSAFGHSAQGSRPARDGMLEEPYEERSQALDRPSRLNARNRFDFSYGDLWIWQFYFILGIASTALAWFARGWLENWEEANYISSMLVSPTTVFFTAFIIGVFLIAVASAEGVLVGRIAWKENSRRIILEKLQEKRLRLVRAARDITAVAAGIAAIVGMFAGYPGPRFAALTTTLASALVLTIISRLNYGDAAFLCGTIIAGCALFMPQSVSGYNMLNGVSGVGFLQLLTVIVMLLFWYFSARPPVLIALALFCAIPIALTFATIEYGNFSIVGPYVSSCGVGLALIAGLLGDGIGIRVDAGYMAPTLLGAGLNHLAAAFGKAKPVQAKSLSKKS